MCSSTATLSARSLNNLTPRIPPPVQRRERERESVCERGQGMEISTQEQRRERNQMRASASGKQCETKRDGDEKRPLLLRSVAIILHC